MSRGEKMQDCERQSRRREHGPDHPADEPGFQIGDLGADTGSFPPQLGADLGDSGLELGGRDVGRPCSASFRIALAMTAAWSLSMPPGGHLPGDRERVEQGVNPYDRPESRTTMRCRLRETTSVIVAVQESPRLSVMLIGVPRGSSASAATPGPSSTAPQPSPSLQGFQPARGCLLGASRSAGSSRSSAAAMTSRAQALTLTCRSSRSRARRSRSSGSMRIWKTSVRSMT